MYPVWAGPVVAGFLAVWVLVLSFLILQQRNFLKSLFPKSENRDIRKKFEEVTKAIEEFKLKVEMLEGKVSEIAKDGTKHVQRVELLRFNPYADTGGDQSFTVALLDQEGSGVIITSLHARSATRVFAKDVKFGKSGKYRLSKEEEQVLEKITGKK